jgi:hypothetical protein
MLPAFEIHRLNRSVGQGSTVRHTENEEEHERVNVRAIARLRASFLIHTLFERMWF